MITIIKSFFEDLGVGIDSLIADIFSVIAPNGDYKYAKYTIAGIFGLGMFFLILYMRKNNIIKNSIRNGYEQLVKRKMGLKTRKRSVKAEDNPTNNQILLQFELEAKKAKKKRSSFIEAFDEKFVYSRLDKKIPFLTSDIWLAFIIVVFLLSFIIFSISVKNVIRSLILSAAIAMIPIVIEWVMAYKNYKSVDSELITFLNLLGNYSIQSSELTSVFKEIKDKVKDPLKSVLEDAIYDAEHYGPDAALIRLSDKIEHPRFKLIIHNVRVSLKHSNSFKKVVDNNRVTAADFVTSQKEKSNLIRYNFFSIVVITIISIAGFAILGLMLETDMLHFFLNTTQGNISLAVNAIVYIYFIHQLYSIDK